MYNILHIYLPTYLIILNFHCRKGNSHSATHGGDFNWDQFCNLSIEELGECQNKRYYKERSTGVLKDKDGQRVDYNQSTGKLEAIK